MQTSPAYASAYTTNSAVVDGVAWVDLRLYDVYADITYVSGQVSSNSLLRGLVYCLDTSVKCLTEWQLKLKIPMSVKESLG